MTYDLFLIFQFSRIFKPYEFCAANPCKNSGTCVDGQDNYTCQCAKGWTGPTCDAVGEYISCFLIVGNV